MYEPNMSVPILENLFSYRDRRMEISANGNKEKVRLAKDLGVHETEVTSSKKINI